MPRTTISELQGLEILDIWTFIVRTVHKGENRVKITNKWCWTNQESIKKKKKVHFTNTPKFNNPYLQSLSSVQSLSHIWLFATSWTAACQAFLSITNSWSLLKIMSIESVMPSKHLIFCHPLLLLLSIFASIRVFSNESVLCIRWPK